MKNTWTNEELEKAKQLLYSGKNFKQISEILNKSHNCVSKKMRREGLKFKNINRDVISNYLRFDWEEIQKFYINSSYRAIQKQFKLSPQAIQWAIETGNLVTRNRKEAAEKRLKEGGYNKSKKSGIQKYRLECDFKFNLSDYPNKFNFSLIQKYGWYKAKNKGNNPNGVSRDHMYSVSEGFKNDVPAEIISHPANCKLMLHRDNNKKKNGCSITLDELKERIREWDKQTI